MGRFGKKRVPIEYDTRGFAGYLSAEQREHARLVEVMHGRYPKALWFHPMNEGKRTKFEQYLWSIMGGKKSVSDFIFFDQRHGYSGMAIELKTEAEKIFKKDGGVYSDKVDQHLFLEGLQNRGWYATFALGFQQAFDFVTAYYAEEADRLSKLKPLI